MPNGWLIMGGGDWGGTLGKPPAILRFQTSEQEECRQVHHCPAGFRTKRGESESPGVSAGMHPTSGPGGLSVMAWLGPRRWGLNGVGKGWLSRLQDPPEKRRDLTFRSVPLPKS